MSPVHGHSGARRGAGQKLREREQKYDVQTKEAGLKKKRRDTSLRHKLLFLRTMQDAACAPDLSQKIGVFVCSGRRILHIMVYSKLEDGIDRYSKDDLSQHWMFQTSKMGDEQLCSTKVQTVWCKVRCRHSVDDTTQQIFFYTLFQYVSCVLIVGGAIRHASLLIQYKARHPSPITMSRWIRYRCLRRALYPTQHARS